jgi:hypothetical protein
LVRLDDNVSISDDDFQKADAALTCIRLHFVVVVARLGAIPASLVWGRYRSKRKSLRVCGALEIALNRRKGEVETFVGYS